MLMELRYARQDQSWKAFGDREPLRDHKVFSFHSAVASLQDSKANIECLALENHALAVTQFNPCTIINLSIEKPEHTDKLRGNQNYPNFHHLETITVNILVYFLLDSFLCSL